jgi:hypothetical protein
MEQDKKSKIADAALVFHQAWVNLVNFHHPKMHSSRAAEALEAIKAQRLVQDSYDGTLAQLTSICELYRQRRLGGRING